MRRFGGHETTSTRSSKAQLTKVGFSRSDDGKPDAWALPEPDGRIIRIEISSTRDEGKIDRWERYEPKGTSPGGSGAYTKRVSVK